MGKVIVVIVILSAIAFALDTLTTIKCEGGWCRGILTLDKIR